MSKVKSKLTVLFKNPFWVGIYEREENGQYEVCKITFGAEPKDYEVYEFILKHWNRLKFSPSIDMKTPDKNHINPKRMQRLIKRQMTEKGIGTKAQQALALQREKMSTEHKANSREIKKAEKDRKFTLKQLKQKEKHKGH